MKRSPLHAKRPRRKSKPRAVPAVRVYRDGREVCNLRTAAGRREYQRRIEVMALRQGYGCCICTLHMWPDDRTFEHQDGRGMGGGHRDDRIEKDGKPYNGVAHGLCNMEKGSKRIGRKDGTRA